MLTQFIKMVHPVEPARAQPRIIICVPCGSTQVERRAIKESVSAAGASQVFLIEEPMAAAIGAGLPVSEKRRARWWSTSAWYHRSRHHLAGRHGLFGIGARRRRQVRRSHHQLHSPQLRHADRRTNCESIKKEIGSAFPGSEVREMEVKGRNLSEGIPRSFTISSNEILEALTDPLKPDSSRR